MIRKPTEAEFRDGAVVVALRETKKVAQGTQKGLQRGGRALMKIYMFFIMGGGLLASAASGGVGGGGTLWGVGVLGFIIAWRNRGQLRRGEGRFTAVIEEAVTDGAPDSESPRNRYELETTALGQQLTAFVLLGLGSLLAGYFLFSSQAAVFVMSGMIAIVLAVLVGARLVGDRAALVLDSQGVIANGLLKAHSLRWGDIDDAQLHSFSRCDLPVLFAIGSRHALIIRSDRNRLGGATRLLVPVTMLGLDRDGIIALLDTLLQGREPRAARAEISRPIEPAPQLQPALAVDPRASFDPDAIMARYLTERDATISAVRPDLVDARKPMASTRTFGRKAA